MAKHIAEQFALPSMPPVIDGKAEVVTLVNLTPENSINVPGKDHSFWGQLTVVYHDAVGAMPKVLIFGSLMLWLRDQLADSARGVGVSGRATGGKFGDKGTGLKAILKECAPEISEATAYRFMAVAEAVREEFRLSARVAKQIDFIGLATTPADQLPEPLRDKQLELFSFVSGTSQRSWLDKYKTKKPLGGKRDKKAPATDEEVTITPEQAARDLWIPVLDGLKREGLDERSWMHLSDEDRTALKGLLKDVLDCINGKLK